MQNVKIRNTSISLFVILWTLVFHYESVRYFYLNDLFKREMPKLKFLFPPAGWIMFYNVGEGAGYYEVYGVKAGRPQMIDPHDILRTRTFGYDNIHRGILGGAAGKGRSKDFCRFLERRFPYFDSFIVTLNYHPHMVDEPYERIQRVEYQCVK